ncbi:MAG: hypothetical protein KGQ28_11285, partial [Hyphomicrobiales bacterium]|nr:hypothetical protein [Hyphomicrobiales bacterium]
FRQGQGRGAGFGGRRFAERDPRLGFAGAPLAPPSAALAATGLLRRVGGMSPRHALILSICARMPELLDVHVEEVAELDLPPGGEAAALRDRLIAVAGEAPEARADIAVQATALKVLAAVRPADGWVLAETASALDAAAGLRQALAVNRRAGALHCEMRAAEARLARDPSEDNQAALYALKAQLADVEGTEASMDGFGAASGRGGQTA